MKNILSVLTVILFVLAYAFGQEAPTKPSREDNHHFGKAEYLQATSTGQKKAAPPVKGTLVFDPQRRYVDFLQDSGSPALSIKFDDIKSMTYEKASKPRMAEAVLISPLFLLSNSKKHYLTFEYTDDSGQGKYAIIHLDKKNAREAVACAEAQTGKNVEQVDEK
jgi:hypothetical protein